LETTYTIVALEKWPWRWSLHWKEKETTVEESSQKEENKVFQDELLKYVPILNIEWFTILTYRQAPPLSDTRSLGLHFQTYQHPDLDMYCLLQLAADQETNSIRTTTAGRQIRCDRGKMGSFA